METTPSIGLDFVNLFRCVTACSPMVWWVEETVMLLSRQPGVQQQQLARQVLGMADQHETVLAEQIG